MAQSFAFQNMDGFCTYCAKSCCTYPPTAAVQLCGNLAANALISSHAALRLVSWSPPSISLRKYSAKLSVKISSSSVRNCKFGMAIFSMIFCNVSGASKSVWCTPEATTVKNAIPEDATRSRYRSTSSSSSSWLF